MGQNNKVERYVDYIFSFPLPVLLFCPIEDNICQDVESPPNHMDEVLSNDNNSRFQQY